MLERWWLMKYIYIFFFCLICSLLEYTWENENAFEFQLRYRRLSYFGNSRNVEAGASGPSKALWDFIG